MQIDRARELTALAQQIRICRRCQGLNEPGITEAAPGYGTSSSPVVIIGQSLCRPCMATQIPFTGGSGHLLDSAFDLARVRKEHLFITNVVHCHPPDNRQSHLEEIANCSEYLSRELEIVKPKLVVGLGKDAHQWLLNWVGAAPLLWSLSLPAKSVAQPALLLVPHPSYIRRRSEAERIAYIDHLARALRWAFDS